MHRNLASWCDSPSFFPGTCYESDHICCVTCSNHNRGTAECRYGDKISWCPTINPGQCYNANTEDSCCETCARHKDDSKPQCRYGDSFNWCRNVKHQCNEADIRDKCCRTCADYQSTTTSTTTTRGPSTPTPTTTTPRPGSSADLSTVRTTTTTTRPTTTTKTTTTPPPTTTTAFVTIKPKDCPNGDDASWCSTIPSSYCYTQEDICCATCNQKLISSDHECRYGDKFTWCKNYGTASCSDSNIRNGCCQLCKDHTSQGLNPAPSCRKDTASWCADIDPWDCYQPQTSSTCCQTCGRHRTGEQDCDYGDRADWCTTAFSSYECYKLGSTCCHTCATRYFVGIQGCEYGDKTPVCEGLDCTDPNIRDLCCGTCAESTKEVTAAIATTATARPPLPDQGCLGDTVSWCSRIKNFNCYADEDVCCETCLKFYLGFRGCEYGDRVSWCESTIKTASDCERSDIGNNCCYTCALKGNPSTRENPEEWREGVLVGFLKKDLSKVIEEEMDMLMFLSHQVNEYCLDNPEHCCAHIYASPRKTEVTVPSILVDDVDAQPIPQRRSNLRLVLPSDCHIAGGYPRQSETDNGEVITKYLVKLRPEALEELCGGPQEDGVRGNRHRSKRDTDKRKVKAIYFDKHKLRDLIVENKDVIESAMGLQISRVSLSGEAKSTGFKVVVGIAAGALVAFIAVSIALFITIKKLTRPKKVKHSDESGPYQPSSALGFRPGKNKVRHWDQMTGSMSSISTASSMTSPVYLSNEKLQKVPFVPGSGPSFVTFSTRQTQNFPTSGPVTSPSPPPPYNVKSGSGSDDATGWTSTNQRPAGAQY